MIKWGVRPIHNLISTKDIFDVSRSAKKIEMESLAEEARNKYLEIIKENGDIHFYKKTTFGPGHSRVVNNINIYFIIIF